MAQTNKTCLIPIATGTEEIEAVVVIDTLRRAGVDVTVASVEPDLVVRCSRGVKLVADKSISEALTQAYDCIALPGGMPGAQNLASNEQLVEGLRAQKAEGRLIAAICAAPAVILQAIGLLDDVEVATCHPAFVEKLGSKGSESRVVKSNNIITSRGPGTALEFSLALIHELLGKEVAEKVAMPMMIPPGLPIEASSI